MTATNTFNQGPAFLSQNGVTWAERVVKADHVWQQIEAMLKAGGHELPAIPRRPDVRLIIENTSGNEIQFYNPGDHSMSKPEIIPANGDKKAVMVMVAGDTLLQQVDNAATLFNTYNLASSGLSPAFLNDLQIGKLTHDPRRLISEAYGPAPFVEQVSKLVTVSWPQDNGASELVVNPQVGASAAFGVRAATKEQAFLADFPIFVKGTTTTPERVESDGMVVALEHDWQTKIVKTRPIAPSIAKGFYGTYYNNLPIVTVDPDGTVHQINLRNGTILKPAEPVQTKRRGARVSRTSTPNKPA